MLKNAWAGQERLWKVWWGLGIPLICITFLINAYLAYVLQVPPGSPVALVVGVVRFAVFAAWYRAAWLCARHVNHRIWTVLARGGLLVWVATSLAQVQHRW